MDLGIFFIMPKEAQFLTVDELMQELSSAEEETAAMELSGLVQKAQNVRFATYDDLKRIAQGGKMEQ